MEKLKDALLTMINIAEKSDEALVDGKIDIAEGIGLAMSAIGLVSVARNATAIKDEYMALTPDEATALSGWFAEEFDIIDDNLESIIEMIFDVLFKLGDVLEALKKK